jgi:hypothetical protein
MKKLMAASWKGGSADAEKTGLERPHRNRRKPIGVAVPRITNSSNNVRGDCVKAFRAFKPVSPMMASGSDFELNPAPGRSIPHTDAAPMKAASWISLENPWPWFITASSIEMR